MKSRYKQLALRVPPQRAVLCCRCTTALNIGSQLAIQLAALFITLGSQVQPVVKPAGSSGQVRAPAGEGSFPADLRGTAACADSRDADEILEQMKCSGSDKFGDSYLLQEF